MVGIGRLAAQSPPLKERAEVNYYALPTRSTLNRESSGRMPFAWTINPYRGCEFGCKYCYARYTHEFMEMWDGQDFERKIYAKMEAPELLRAELRAAKDRGLPIAIGTATDPYQPAESQFRITRRMLETFLSFEGLQFSLTTKSVLILRDLDLLQALARKHHLSLHLTITTVHERLARLLEPKAPPPEKRLEALARLRAAGLRVGVNVMPIVPGITDGARDLEELTRRAAERGACFLAWNLLFLMPSAMKQFMPFLEKEFPHLVKKYSRAYARSAYLSGPYKECIHRLMTELRRKYGLESGREAEAAEKAHAQLALGFEPQNPT